MILKVVIYGPFRVIAAGTVKVGVLGPLKERLILMIPVILFQQPCQNPQCAPDPLKGIALSGTDFFPEKPGDRFFIVRPCILCSRPDWYPPFSGHDTLRAVPPASFLTCLCPYLITSQVLPPAPPGSFRRRQLHNRLCHTKRPPPW